MRLVLILIASATLGVGCAFPRGRSEPATFFTLTPLETLGGAAGEPAKEVLGLGPLAIPGYLDRPQLVTRVGANEVQLAAVARWGLREVPRGRVLLVRESRIVEHAEDAGTGAAVAALSRTLGALAREIAAAVREVEPHGAGAAGSRRP